MLNPEQQIELGLTAIFSRQALMAAATGEFEFVPKLIKPEHYNVLLDRLNQIDPAEVGQGKFTLAIIKPTVRTESNLDQFRPPVALRKHAATDEIEVTQRLMAEMPNNLTPHLVFSLLMKPADVEIFYGQRIRNIQQTAPPVDPHRYGETHLTRWDEFLRWLIREPATFIILEDTHPSQKDNAVTKWLEAVGRGQERSWDVEEIKRIWPDSLRGRFARDNHNNIFHASASVEEVGREIEAIKEMVQRRRR